jgi:hypothetical protein
MTHDEMIEVARGNIERHIGDVEDPLNVDAIYDEAYTLGFDALVDKGVEAVTARAVAREVAIGFAQP